ncbi:histidine kinase [Rhodococcus sp. NPDC076796]|uniref:sensor histidine kinase n=1 Tax=Rhodococcus sp. NPDC076796 TaxID=3154859 RepID=UPI00344F128C
MNTVDASTRCRAATALMIVALVALTSVPSPGPWTAAAVAVCAAIIGLGPNPFRRIAVAWILGASVLIAVLVAWGSVWTELPRDVLYASLRMGVPWLAGFAWQLRTQVRNQAVEELTAARQRRTAAAERDRAKERLELAESLHDDLGHSLSLVALDLGRLELDSTLTPSAQESVGTARKQLARAVERLGDSVESLRVGAAPGLPRRDTVDALIQRARESGVDVEVTSTVDVPNLPEAAHNPLSRVLQEALTNASKHAPGLPITVEIAGDGAYSSVRVSNPVENTAEFGRGTGLQSTADLLRRSGGDLRVDLSEGEFDLRARIPHRPLPMDPMDMPPEDDIAGLTRAQRRGRLLLVGAALVAVSMLAAVESFNWFEARRTVLSEDDFQNISVGDSRGDAAGVLPEHELPGEAGGTGECHLYAVTADRFADSSGNRYRICYNGDTVSEVSLISE